MTKQPIPITKNPSPVRIVRDTLGIMLAFIIIGIVLRFDVWGMAVLGAIVGVYFIIRFERWEEWKRGR